LRPATRLRIGYLVRLEEGTALPPSRPALGWQFNCHPNSERPSRRNCSTSFARLAENGLVTTAQSAKIEKKLPFGRTGNRNLYSGSNHRIRALPGGAIPQSCR
jgi:hypothetical protein